MLLRNQTNFPLNQLGGHALGFLSHRLNRISILAHEQPYCVVDRAQPMAPRCLRIRILRFLQVRR
jgi:hypothetical protein